MVFSSALPDSIAGSGHNLSNLEQSKILLKKYFYQSRLDLNLKNVQI